MKFQASTVRLVSPWIFRILALSLEAICVWHGVLVLSGCISSAWPFLYALVSHFAAAGCLFALPAASRYELFMYRRRSIREQISELGQYGISESRQAMLLHLKTAPYRDETVFQRALEKILADETIPLVHKSAVVERIKILYLPEDLRHLRDMRYYSHLSGWLTLFLPFVGIVGSFLVLSMIGRLIRPKGLVAECHEESGYFQDTCAHSGAIDIGEETSVEPALNILESGDEELKRGAVSLLGTIGSPEAVRILKKYLNDDSHEVRFYAHFNIGKLDDKHTGRVKEIQTLLKSDSDNPAYLKQLGNVYMEYAQSGLMESDTAMYYLGLAKDAYLAALPLSPKDHETAMILGELSVLEKNYKDAEGYFKKAMENSPVPVVALLGLCQTYYETKNREALKKIAEQISELGDGTTGDLDKDILVRFWTEGIRSCRTMSV